MYQNIYSIKMRAKFACVDKKGKHNYIKAIYYGCFTAGNQSKNTQEDNDIVYSNYQ